MLDYTKAAITQVVDDFKRIDYIRNIVTQVLYIVYLVYALFDKPKFLAANIPLFLLSVAYFIFFLIATQKNAEKKLKKTVHLVFKRCKQVINFFTLAVTVYGVAVTATDVTPFGLILTSFMIVGWVLQIVFEIVIKFFVKRVNLIVEGLEADYEKMTQPVRSMGNFFKKLSGKEVEEKERSEVKRFLDKKVEEAKAAKKQLKLDEKAERKQKKLAEKAAKKEAKRAKKGNLAPVQAEIAPSKTKK
jgi:hypothetical protein